MTHPTPNTDITLTVDPVPSEKPRLNVELLRKVRDVIRAKPGLCDEDDIARAVLTASGEVTEDGWEISQAAELTGTDHDYLWAELLVVGAWDEPYRTNYWNAKTPQERANIVASYIDYFIEQHTDEVQP
jgi:hypothetical protein